MNNHKTLLESVSQKATFKRKFTLLELYRALVLLPEAIAILSENHKIKLVHEHFLERLQLAVTEVNGCAVCSYQHTKMALEQGLSNEEISSFLSGEGSFIKPEEAKGILFAQHYADTRGFPKRTTYHSIVKEYGVKEARIILSSIQVITVGNMYGIPFSALLSRFKGKPYKESTLFYELGLQIGGLFCMPLAFLHGWLRWVFNRNKMRFNESTSA